MLKNNDFYSSDKSWFIKNWGTKEDAKDTLIIEENDMIEITFNTVCSPPFIWFQQVSKKNPDIKMINFFVEETQNLFGVIVCTNGTYLEYIFEAPNLLDGLELFSKLQPSTYQDIIQFNDDDETDYELYFSINNKIKSMIHPFLGIKKVVDDIMVIGYYNKQFDYQNKEIIINPSISLHLNEQILREVQELLVKEYNIHTEIDFIYLGQLIIT
jgi:hypothetical protein